jgi:hypothetical protein
MPTYYLINAVRVGSNPPLWPGTLINSAYDNVSQLQSAGATLEPSTNATVTAASPIALAIKARGGNIEDSAQIMMAALAKTGATGDKGPIGDKGPDGDKGPTGDAG